MNDTIKALTILVGTAFAANAQELTQTIPAPDLGGPFDASVSCIKTVIGEATHGTDLVISEPLDGGQVDIYTSGQDGSVQKGIDVYGTLNDAGDTMMVERLDATVTDSIPTGEEEPEQGWTSTGSVTYTDEAGKNQISVEHDGEDTTRGPDLLKDVDAKLRQCGVKEISALLSFTPRMG